MHKDLYKYLLEKKIDNKIIKKFYKEFGGSIIHISKKIDYPSTKLSKYPKEFREALCMFKGGSSMYISKSMPQSKTSLLKKFLLWIQKKC